MNDIAESSAMAKGGFSVKNISEFKNAANLIHTFELSSNGYLKLYPLRSNVSKKS